MGDISSVDTDGHKGNHTFGLPRLGVWLSGESACCPSMETRVQALTTICKVGCGSPHL